MGFKFAHAIEIWLIEKYLIYIINILGKEQLQIQIEHAQHIDL